MTGKYFTVNNEGSEFKEIYETFSTGLFWGQFYFYFFINDFYSFCFNYSPAFTNDMAVAYGSIINDICTNLFSQGTMIDVVHYDMLSEYS